MKAVVYTEYGSPDVLKLKEVDKPTPKDDEVLIKVYAASINSWDWDRLTGKPIEYRFISGLLKPKYTILGCDVSGKIEAVGKNVKKFQPGDEVFGDLCEGSWGAFAEYVCAKENSLVLKPSSMSFEQAAAIPQGACLAIQGLSHNMQILTGQKVLINGACGIVGTFAIQIAKLAGAEVTGVDSTVKLDKMQELGADHVIDYTRDDFTKNGQQYNLILDNVAKHSIFDYKRALKPKGVYVMIGGASSLVFSILIVGSWISLTEGKRMGILPHKPNTDLPYFIELFEAGKVVPIIDRSYPLDETAKAFRYYEKGISKGKIVIKIQD